MFNYVFVKSVFTLVTTLIAVCLIIGFNIGVGWHLAKMLFKERKSD